VRERFELNDAPLFGIAGNKSDSYLLDRPSGTSTFAECALADFVEFEDVRAPAKDVITPVDENPLDLRLAFITYVDSILGRHVEGPRGAAGDGVRSATFVSVRDGPNVRQAYDAAWLDWEATRVALHRVLEHAGSISSGAFLRRLLERAFHMEA